MERPDLLGRSAQNPGFIVRVEKFHVIANYAQSFVVGRPAEVDWPIGRPHQALGAVDAVQPLHVLLRIQPGIPLAGDRPGVRNLHENVRISRQCNQFLEFLRTIDRTVGHVIDNHGEIGALFEQRHQIWHARDWGVHLHRNFERLGAFPQRRHQGAGDPVATGIGGGADPDSVKSLLG